jgi:hypothetical protein
MLSDGHLSEEERDILDQEAQRLHLSQDEVNRLIEKVHQQREVVENQQGIPIERLAQDPQLALERFRELAGQVKQIALMGKSNDMREVLASSDRSTALEKKIWEITSRS